VRTRRIDRQGGWIGLVVVLLALVIVGWLAKDAFRQYGLMPGTAAPAKAGSPGERTRSPGAVAADPPGATSAPASSGAPMDRARGIEGAVKAQADERAARSQDVGK
jgi:hypothetical protein